MAGNSSTTTPHRYDVIVVGAGFSGMASANLLYKAGLDVLVLEASERVGGRLYVVRNEKCGWVDMGGAYIGSTQKRVLRLAKENNVDMYQVYNQGDWVYYYEGKRYRYSDGLAPIYQPLAMIDCNNVFRKMDELCETIPTHEPWKAKDAEAMDNITLQEFFDKTCWTEHGKQAVKGFCRGIYSVEAREVSLLWALWYLKQAGGLHQIHATNGGAQEMKFDGGAAMVPEKLAAKLGIGKRVLLEHPVMKVVRSSEGVTVSTTNGKTFEASYIILATAPALQMKMQFEPALPSVRNQLVQRVPMGANIKVMIYYKTAFWRDANLAGTCFVDDIDPLLPIIGAMDDTKPDGTYPCIMGFMLADKGRHMLQYTKEERCRMLAEAYAKIFGMNEFLHPTHYEEYNWIENQYAGGCYVGFMGPGVLTKFGDALRKPIGRMYFAGTETATEWTGYMEGAVQAGERASREVLHAMGKIEKSEIWKREDEDEFDHKHSFTKAYLPSVPGVLKAGSVVAAAVLARTLLKSKS